MKTCQTGKSSVCENDQTDRNAGPDPEIGENECQAACSECNATEKEREIMQGAGARHRMVPGQLAGRQNCRDEGEEE